MRRISCAIYSTVLSAIELLLWLIQSLLLLYETFLGYNLCILLTVPSLGRCRPASCCQPHLSKLTATTPWHYNIYTTYSQIYKQQTVIKQVSWSRLKSELTPFMLLSTMLLVWNCDSQEFFFESFFSNLCLLFSGSFLRTAFNFLFFSSNWLKSNVP